MKMQSTTRASVFLLPRALPRQRFATHGLIMPAMLATKADFDKALADAGSKLVASLVRRLAPALGSSAGSQPLAWP